MLEKNKKIMSMSLCAILFSTMIASTPVQAKSNTVQAKSDTIYSEDIEITEDFAREQLLTIGFSEKEADELIKEFPVTEKNMGRNPNNSFKSSLGLMSSPNPGDTDIKTYTITATHIKALGYGIAIGGNAIGYGLSKTKWAEIIIKTLGWKGIVAAGVIGTAAGACAYMHFAGYSGVKLTVTHTYIYGDNLMTYYWAITDIDEERFK